MTPTKAEELAECWINPDPKHPDDWFSRFERAGWVRFVPASVDQQAERDALRADSERLDWIERAALARKIEIARSLLGAGFEIGQWPSMRVTVTNGPLRAAIDAARATGEHHE